MSQTATRFWLSTPSMFPRARPAVPMIPMLSVSLGDLPPAHERPDPKGDSDLGLGHLRLDTVRHAGDGPAIERLDILRLGLNSGDTGVDNMNVRVDRRFARQLFCRHGGAGQSPKTGKRADERRLGREPKNLPSGRSGSRRFVMSHTVAQHKSLNEM